VERKRSTTKTTGFKTVCQREREVEGERERERRRVSGRESAYV
jgi:hypothetical protein